MAGPQSRQPRVQRDSPDEAPLRPLPRVHEQPTQMQIARPALLGPTRHTRPATSAAPQLTVTVQYRTATLGATMPSHVRKITRPAREVAPMPTSRLPRGRQVMLGDSSSSM